MPLADLILLVGRGDDLTFLQPGRLTLPGIENWQGVPSRFRIVTTYSYFTQTIRDMIRAHPGPLGADVLRVRLVEQIEKAGALAPQARNPERFFPLEFGTSWLDTQAREPGLHERVSPLIADLKQQLRHDIRASTGRFARLKSAMMAHGVARELVAARRTETQVDLGVEDGRIDILKAELALARDALARLSRRLDKASHDEAGLDSATLGDDVQHFTAWPVDALDSAGTTVSGFRAVIEQVRMGLAQWASNVRPWPQDRAAFWRRLSIGDRTTEVDQIVEQAFLQLTARLNGYVLDDYWFTSSANSDHGKDLKLLVSCRSEAQVRLRAAVSSWWLQAAQAAVDAIRREVADIRKDLEAWREVAAMIETKLTAAHAERERIVDRLDAFERHLAVELAESGRFDRLLDEHYLDELRTRRRDIAGTTPPARRLVALLAAVQLADARRKLRHDVEQETN